ncbi:MAG: UTRA domain-containing protein, partial [Hamadaea sp.]|nr:UTRA domain-containing protein [Hamadaea sp.]
EVEERIITRAATPAEATALDLRGRTAPVIAIRRTYLASDRPVETADIVLPSERYELVYRMPV